MTDLERVRALLVETATVYGMPEGGYVEAFAIIDAHLKEDAERDRRIMYCPEGHVLYVKDPQPGRDYACARCDLEAELAELREDLKYREDQYEGLAIRFDELQEAVRDVKSLSHPMAYPKCHCIPHDRLRQLIEED